MHTQRILASERPVVSVVIPTLNEAHNLPLVLPYLPLDWIDEVILVDGRSTDGTAELAERLLPTIRLICEPKRGKGAALQAGFSAARGDIIITLDADGSNDPREIPRLVRALMEGADFVKGSRFAPGGGTTDMPRLRKWGNGALGDLVNILFNGEYTDLCYGYHAFWRHCLDTIQGINADGFEIDTAIYVRVLREHLRIQEVPSFEGYRFYGVGKLQTLPDGFRVLATIMREWLDHFTAKPSPNYLGFRGHRPMGPHAAGQETDPGLLLSDEIRMLHTMSDELDAQPGLSERLQRLLQLALEQFCAASGSIVVLNKCGQVVQGALAFDGEVRPQAGQDLAETVTAGLAGWVVEHREAALLPNTVSDPRWLRRPWEADGVARSAISVPLITRDQAFGVLTLVHPEGGQFTQSDLTLLMAIAVGASMHASTQLAEDCQM